MKMKEFFNKHMRYFIIGGGVIIVIAIIITSIFIIKAGNSDKTSTDTKESQTKEETQSDEETQTEEETTQSTSEDVSDPQPKDIVQGNGVQIDAKDLNAGSNNYEVSGITYGIDVSKYQGKINWSSVKSDGIEFAIIRIGYRTDDKGVICEDSYAKYNLQNAIKAGVKVGVYFFSTAVNTAEAQEEAAWVTNFIANYNITYPVVYNSENFTSSSSRMYGLSNSQRTDNAVAFLSYVASKGYTPMFYANSGELSGSSSWDTAKLSAQYKIWVAQYPSTAYTSGAKSSYTGTHAMWQYTNKGTVSGISGNVDINIAYFGYSVVAAPKEAGVVEEATEPTTADPFTAANEQVTAKIETNLRNIPSTGSSSQIVYVLKNGEFITRTGVNSSTGWSRVVYNGQTLYAVSSNLTTSTEPATTAADPFTAVNEQVTAKSETNLRTSPNTGSSSSVVYTLKNGEYVTRTGINSSTGWSRVEYNGQVLYAVSSYLTN